MPAALPIPLAIPEERQALARMYVELTLAFHATIYPLDQAPAETDANLALVAVAVMLGHAEGRPMTSSEIASRVQMPRSSVLRRLEALIAHGLIQRIEDKYYLEPTRAAGVPHKDKFEFILSKGFAVLGPMLSKTDT
jgi:IclR helix-turn-helix domain